MDVEGSLFRNRALFAIEHGNRMVIAMALNIDIKTGSHTRAGAIRADVNPIIARRAFFGALDEIAMQWILTPNARYGLNESAEQIAELFVRGLSS